MFSQALRNPMGVEFPSKYALLLLTKKNILNSILRTRHTLCFAKIPLPKKWSIRDVTVGVFFFWYQSTERELLKKIRLNGISKKF